jgi:serine/threonine protein kinase
MAPGAPLLSPGHKLGKYRLVKRLAVGGMAEIYLARVSGSEGFEKLVALKRILPQHAANDEFIQMFLNEARIAATLHHPNIAQTYDIGHEGGSYFFTMEYVHGEDMRTLTKKAKHLPLEHALNIVIGVCGGLHHAHEKRGNDGRPLGLVHRDVSPSNVLVTYDGAVKMVDFGIAKATSHRAETRVGTLKGKIAYMSPEQCRGEGLDRRADVFSIGILLYEFTTGHRLFKGDNEFAILNMIVNQDVTPPTQLVPGYPRALEPIVLKALARDRDQRYANAEEMQVDLEAFARDHRLAVSSISLARFMESVFGKKTDPWHEIAAASVDMPLTPPEDDITPGPIDLREYPRAGSVAETNPLRRHEDVVDSNMSQIVAVESAPTLVPLRRFWPGAIAAVGALAAIGLVAVVMFAPSDRAAQPQRAPKAPVDEPPAPSILAPPPPAPPPAVLVPVPMATPPAPQVTEPPPAVPAEAKAVPVAAPADDEPADDEPTKKKKKKKAKKDGDVEEAGKNESREKEKKEEKKEDLDSLFPPE